jgi:hypothetical protein
MTIVSAKLVPSPGGAWWLEVWWEADGKYHTRGVMLDVGPLLRGPVKP